MTKNELRQHLKEQRDGLLPEIRKEYSKALRERLFQSEIYQSCELLFSFMSFRSEVETGEIIGRALEDRKRVFLPRINEKNMEFYEVHGLEELVLNSYGIPEPEQRIENRYQDVPSERGLVKLMLLPGLAFDPDGNRLGYGAGYYDKYLSRFEDSFFIKIALAYELQVVDRIEANIHDKKANYILTPERIINC